MADGAAAGTGGAGAGGGTPPATPPWYEGKAEAEIVGHWQNRGLDISDPTKIAIEMTKQHRDVERLLGAPANEILRMPKANAAAADVKAFWEKLGAPKEGKDYDLSAIKQNGKDLDVGFADTVRKAFAENYVPKDRAAPIVDAIVKHIAGQETAAAAAMEARKAEAAANLDKLWGANKTKNMLDADQGAQRVGFNGDEVKKMSDAIGADRVAELFRQIGAGTKEDGFVEGKTAADPATSQGAAARLAELQNDAAWRKALLSGGVKERQEFDSLTKLASGWRAEAA